MKQRRKSRTARLDRFICERVGVNRRDVRAMLAGGRIELDDSPASHSSQVIGQFTRVTLDGEVLQSVIPEYIMLNKPAGVVSATRDPQHRTVIDLLGRDHTCDLHIAGRLDFNSTGLLLLTNDGSWSRHIASPEQGVRKLYRVTLEKPLTPDYVDAFNDGMYFEFEDVTTRPATLKILSKHIAEVGLTEGRYHQIKRMFGRFRNPVTSLHRVTIGNLTLDPELGPGQSRDLTQAERNHIS